MKIFPTSIKLDEEYIEEVIDFVKSIHDNIEEDELEQNNKHPSIKFCFSKLSKRVTKTPIIKTKKFFSLDFSLKK